MDLGHIANSGADSQIEKKQQIQAATQLGQHKNIYSLFCDTTTLPKV